MPHAFAGQYFIASISLDVPQCAGPRPFVKLGFAHTAAAIGYILDKHRAQHLRVHTHFPMPLAAAIKTALNLGQPLHAQKDEVGGGGGNVQMEMVASPYW